MQLEWDSIGQHAFESGVDRGVFYSNEGVATPWSGLVSAKETLDSTSESIVYMDGEKKANQLGLGSFTGTIEAITYPDEFLPYDGYSEPAFSGQKRKTFNFSYRTLIDSDSDGSVGYKIHLVYNCLAKPSAKSNISLNSSLDISTFSWDITTVPEVFPYNYYRPTAHLILDSTKIVPPLLGIIESLLYGDVDTTPTFPSLLNLIDIFEANAIIKVIDLGDGSCTVIGPDEYVSETEDPTEWVLSWPTVIEKNSDTYRISSY